MQGFNDFTDHSCLAEAGFRIDKKFAVDGRFIVNSQYMANHLLSVSYGDVLFQLKKFFKIYGGVESMSIRLIKKEQNHIEG